ncbi:hypothetical protein DV515_00015860, partial [Chloebia gouldiae]
ILHNIFCRQGDTCYVPGLTPLRSLGAICSSNKDPPARENQDEIGDDRRQSKAGLQNLGGGSTTAAIPTERIQMLFPQQLQSSRGWW